MKSSIVLIAPTLFTFVAALGAVAGLWAAGWLRFRGLLAGLTPLAGLTVFAVIFVWSLPCWYPTRWIVDYSAGDPSGVTRVFLFGYGYRQQDGQIVGDPIHEQMLLWVLAHTKALILDVQESYFQTAIQLGWIPRVNGDHTLENTAYPGRRIHRLHLHLPDINVTTAEAFVCGLPTIARNETVGIGGHPYHLGRIAYNAQIIAPEQSWTVLNVVNPGWDPQSVHPQTRSRGAWTRYEVLAARPFDLFRPIPTACPAPLD